MVPMQIYLCRRNNKHTGNHSFQTKKIFKNSKKKKKKFCPLLPVSGSKGVTEIKWKENEPSFHLHFIEERLTSLFYIVSVIVCFLL